MPVGRPVAAFDLMIDAPDALDLRRRGVLDAG
jgi:hypothetical protein